MCVVLLPSARGDTRARMEQLEGTASGMKDTF